ncbi:unnamed protein product [Adineta steineri]|uniref:Uncharacterized protein n=1 Tax=Adineta steineri TaxID=433720 RepID=A0A815DIQ2_9BILA|nr:unnamed protein product [Adineta steineri]
MTTTTTTQSKENDCNFPLFKTPIRDNILSSATRNDLTFYSNNLKHLKFNKRTSMNDLEMYHNTIVTPIRSNKNKFSTPGSIQRRRALGLVNSNSKKISHISSSDDLSSLTTFQQINNNYEEPVILQAPSSEMTSSHHPDDDDDLPHQPNSIHRYEDTFDDLIPTNERIEHMITNQTNGLNIFTFSGGIENTIRYQSPQCSRVDISTLLDILN